MAAVFLMQPLGQICAAAVGWGVAASLSHGQIAADGTTLEDPTQTVDKIWRCVIGVGAFPALIAILYRVSIPESPRYTMDVSRDGKRALLDTNRYFAVQTDYDTALSSITSDNDGAGGVAEDEPPNYFTYRELREYFWVEGNWRYLVATSMCWFLLDFAFYGLGINSPIKLAAIWASAQSSTTTPSEDWQNPYVVNGKQIYNVLFENAKQYIITISTGSILGSVALILLIDKIPRIKWLIGSFIILALFFMITAATLSTVEFTPTHSLTIVFYTICQFFFNFGTCLVHKRSAYTADANFSANRSEYLNLHGIIPVKKSNPCPNANNIPLPRSRLRYFLQGTDAHAMEFLPLWANLDQSSCNSYYSTSI